MSTALALTTSAAPGPLTRPALAPRPSGGAPAAPQPKLERAKLLLHDAQPGSGGQLGALLGELAFQYNPRELTISKTANWNSQPARGAQKAAQPEFTGAGPGKISLELFFDASTTHDGSVVAAVEQLLTCCVPTEASRGAGRATPPLVVLQWGTTRSFPAYVASVTAKYTLFTPGGTPIRATASVALEEVPGVLARQNPTSGSPGVRRLHTLVEGDTLASVAYAEYGDPTLWRALAAHNGVDDPVRLRAGTTLLVPGPDDLAVGG